MKYKILLVIFFCFSCPVFSAKTLFVFDFINNTGDKAYDFLCKKIPGDLKQRFSMYENLNVVRDTVKQEGRMVINPQMEQYLVFGELYKSGKSLVINVSVRYPSSNELYKKEIFVNNIDPGNINQKMIVLKTITFFEDHFLSKICVETRPGQALIYIDRVKCGYTPLDTLLIHGKYQVTLKKAGYSTLVKKLEITRDHSQFLFTLSKKVSQINLNGQNEKPLPRLFPTTISFAGSAFFGGVAIIASTLARRHPYPRIRDFSIAISGSLLVAGIYGYKINKKRLKREPFKE